MQQTAEKNGKGTQVDAKNPKDTAKGAAVAAIATAKAEPQPLSPLQEKLRKISEITKLSEKRKRLMDGLDKVNAFDEKLDGEHEVISLESGRESMEIKKPDVVKKVIEFLRNDLNASLLQVDTELLAVSI